MESLQIKQSAISINQSIFVIIKYILGEIVWRFL